MTAGLPFPTSALLKKHFVGEGGHVQGMSGTRSLWFICFHSYYLTILDLVSRAGASTSSSSSSFIHTSSVLFARQKLTKKARNVKKVERREREIANRPSPILGYRAGQEEKWINCALAKVLLDEDELASPRSTIKQPVLLGQWKCRRSSRMV